MKKVKIYKLTHEAIKPYGFIIDSRCVKDKGYGNDFGVLLKAKSNGWRVGYLIVRDRVIKRLENHPDSLETFEPTEGKLVIAFAPLSKPDEVKVFLLDKPVVVKKHVWHEVAALSKRAEVKIFENIEVGVGYHHLKDVIKV